MLMIISKNDEILFQEEKTFKMKLSHYFYVHSSLDHLDQLKDTNDSLFFQNPTAEQNADFVIYSYLTSDWNKFVYIYDVKRSLSEEKLKEFFKKIHYEFCKVIMNPLYKLNSPINDLQFKDSVNKLMEKLSNQCLFKFIYFLFINETIFIMENYQKICCHICYLTYDNDTNIPEILLSCGHTFCKVCLQSSFMDKCPFCKKGISDRVINEIALMNLDIENIICNFCKFPFFCNSNIVYKIHKNSSSHICQSCYQNQQDEIYEFYQSKNDQHNLLQIFVPNFLFQFILENNEQLIKTLFQNTEYYKKILQNNNQDINFDYEQLKNQLQEYQENCFGIESLLQQVQDFQSKINFTDNELQFLSDQIEKLSLFKNFNYKNNDQKIQINQLQELLQQNQHILNKISRRQEKLKNNDIDNSAIKQAVVKIQQLEQSIKEKKFQQFNDEQLKLVNQFQQDVGKKYHEICQQIYEITQTFKYSIKKIQDQKLNENYVAIIKKAESFKDIQSNQIQNGIKNYLSKIQYFLRNPNHTTRYIKHN